MQIDREVEIHAKILRAIRDELHTLKRHALPMFVEREMPLVDELLAELDADKKEHNRGE